MPDESENEPPSNMYCATSAGSRDDDGDRDGVRVASAETDTDGDGGGVTERDTVALTAGDGDGEADCDIAALAEREALLLGDGEGEAEGVGEPEGCINHQYCHELAVSSALHTGAREASSMRSVCPAERLPQQSWRLTKVRLASVKTAPRSTSQYADVSQAIVSVHQKEAMLPSTAAPAVQM